MRVLLPRGHEVLLAQDGKEGIDLWKEQKPRLVLLDMIMPRLNGNQVLKMRSKLPKAKVVVMSAYTGDQHTFKSLENLADMSISKPFEDIFEIVKKIEAI